MELGTLAGAAKGAAELANKNSGFLGKLFPYFGIKKEIVEMHKENIKNSNLSLETKTIALFNLDKDIKRLKNQAAIAEKAIENAKEGTDFSENSKVDEEWLDRFMDSAKFVSSEEMQLIWAKVLAGEFENPGSIPRNMIRILSEFTPELAQAFRVICSMKVDFFPLDEKGNIIETISDPFVPDNEKNIEFLNNSGLSSESKIELETLGVIKIAPLGAYEDTHTKETLMRIENELILVFQNNENQTQLSTGDVLLTSAGITLNAITEPIEIEGYYDIITDYLENDNVSIITNHDYILKFENGKPIVKRKSEQE